VSSSVQSTFSFFASQTLHNRFFLKKKSGEAKDSAIFPFFILLHKRAKPITPPYPHPPPKARGFIKPLVLPIRPYFKNLSLKKYFLMYYININVAVDTTR
jgi:hypothetical protein